MNSPTSSALRLPSESRVTPSRRERSASVSANAGSELLAAVAVGGERRAAAPPGPFRASRRSSCSVSPSAQWTSSATSSSGCALPRRPSSSVRRALEQVAVDSPDRPPARGRAGQTRELGHEPRQRLAAAPRHSPSASGVADPQQELEPLPQRLVRRAHRGVGDPVADEHPACGRLVRELAHQPRLPAAGLAAEQHERRPRRSPARSSSARSAASSARAADERERRRRHERARAAARAHRARARARSRRTSSAASWVRICCSSCLERRARLEPELVRARLARRGRPRAPRPAGRSGRARASAARGAARAADAPRSAPPARRRAPPARPSARVGLDPLLERRQPQLLEPFGLVPRERLVLELGQRRAAPERERLLEQRRASSPAPCRHRCGPSRRSRSNRSRSSCPARPGARNPGRAVLEHPVGSSFRSRET